MKNINNKKIQIIIIIIVVGTIFFYKSLFFGANKKLQKTFHITPYTREYFQNKTGRITSFDLQSIQKYNTYCKNTKKQSCIAFLYQSRIADQIRLKSVQQAGQIKENKSRLFYNLNTITILQNNRVYPYIFTQLFLPSKTNPKFSHYAIKIGERGIQNFCNDQRCKPYTIAQNIAFTYYYYLHDSIKASNYYQIAAQSPKAPEQLKNMPAIVLGRGGFHIKSAYLRWQKAQNLSKHNTKKQTYYLNKAIMERSLDLINEADTKQNICYQNLYCLQNNGYISKTIKQRKKECTNPTNNHKTNRKEQIKCRGLQYGLQNNYVSYTGNLVYPLDPQMTYQRRSDIQDRWIILKTDINK